MKLSIPEQEKEILTFWKKNDIFNKQTELNKDNPKFIFWDGPPFPTAAGPHMGNILAGNIKDIFGRYHSMMGKYVERRWGWDCAGIPIENLVQKELNIQNISKYEDVEEFNKKCRSTVMKFSSTWENVVERTGRWVDFKNCYRTMDVSYMETVMWILKKFWDEGRIYKSYRVMPYSPKLETTLSNFEASDYRDVEDLGTVVKFKLTSGMYALAYTTTPYTLFSNLALCVNPDLDYSIIESDGQKYLLLSSQVEKFFKFFTVVDTLKGCNLTEATYEPLFLHAKKQKNAFRILADKFVGEDGTGIVHMAPAYGEDDFRVCKDHDINLFDVLDSECKYNNLVPEYEGRFCKDVDKDIVDRLKAENKLFKVEVITHSYPYCDRTNTPLIYRAVEAWYLRVEDIKDRLIKHNDTINWVPKAIGEKRFGNWLRNAKDWNISRTRLWGTCLPIWESSDGDTICVGSIAELEELSGVKVEDLHKDVLDQIVIVRDGKSYTRVPYTVDGWLESGCMPYASHHYPFENKEYVEKNFPADFIAEGLDQTRGWFYTLLVISTLLFNKPPFKNVVVNGLILAEDGQKMSKSKGNFTDPLTLIDRIGADAVRGYLCSSSATHAEPLEFKDQDAEAVNKNIIIPFMSAANFYETYTSADEWVHPHHVDINHVMDRWIRSRFNGLVENVKNDMDRYDLARVIPRFTIFLDELNNKYIRMSRKRFSSGGDDSACATLFYVLKELSLLTAPFLPFIAEYIYRKVEPSVVDHPESSVHLCRFPFGGPSNNKLDQRMEKIFDIITSGHKLRAENSLKVRQPLANLLITNIVCISDEAELIKNELNIKNIEFVTNEISLYDVSFKPNFKTLGKKFGINTQSVAKWIVSDLTGEQFTNLPVTFYENSVTVDDILVIKTPKSGLVAATAGDFVVAIDITLTSDLIKEGWVRDIVAVVQKYRKDNGFKLTDKVKLNMFVENNSIQDLLIEFQSQLEVLLSTDISFSCPAWGAERHDFTIEVNGSCIYCQLDKK